MTQMAIVTEALTKNYGKVRGLAGLDLEVRAGEVFGFLGPNGAGKTTTIRLLLDLIRPSGGHASVLGLDPRSDGPALRSRIGYLAGDFVVDGRQTAAELLTYLGNLRGGVPSGRIDALAERLDLDLSRKIKGLSRGNRQKVGVIQAFMHEPELLILDEPTSGLDPLLQQEFNHMVREATATGTTVFMSSHVMSEVQQVADRAGIIREGRLVAVEGMDDLRHRAVRQVEIVFDEPVEASFLTRIDGVSEVSIDERTVRCRVEGRVDALIKAIATHGVTTISAEEPDLEEFFFLHYNHGADDVA